MLSLLAGEKKHPFCLCISLSPFIFPSDVRPQAIQSRWWILTPVGAASKIRKTKKKKALVMSYTVKDTLFIQRKRFQNIQNIYQYSL